MVHQVCAARNVPFDIARPAALGALSSSLGRRLFGKEIMGDGLLSGNTYFIIGAETGQSKSRAAEPLMQPLLDVEDAIEKEWESKEFQLQDEKELLQKKLKQLEIEEDDEDGDDPQAIRWRIRQIDGELARGCRRLTCEKGTLPYVRDVLVANDCVMTFYSDDARAFLQNVLKSEEFISLLLKGYSLGSLPMGKFKDDKRLKKICISTVLICQPDFVAELFAKGAVSGLLGRFFACSYAGDIRSRNPKAPPISPKVQQQYHNRLTAMVRGIRMAEQPLYVSGTSETNHILWAYGDANAKLANQSPVRINELVVRREEKAARLALILHRALWGLEAAKHRLSPDTVKDAIEITRWFAGHENALFVENHERVVRPVPDRIVAFMSDQKWMKEHKARDGWVKGRELQRSLSDILVEHLKMHLQPLIEDGRIEARTTGTHGGPSNEYRLTA